MSAGDFENIIENALAEAEQVERLLSEYRDGLREMLVALKEILEQVEAELRTKS